MTLRRNCPHDRYEEHPCIDGRWVSQARMMAITPEERLSLTWCHGGEFLPEGALVEVWWCENHGDSGDESNCHIGPTVFPTADVEVHRCRMGRQRLVPIKERNV